jgi:AcrR family transcriptional regulator
MRRPEYHAAVDDNESPLSRRDRLRAQTLEEIEQAAFAIIDADGAHALSMAAVAKAMRMPAPGLYRYFASRDALVAQLVTVAYGQLALAVEQAAAGAARRSPQARVQALAAGYRDWALAHPRRCRMLFGERHEVTVLSRPGSMAASSARAVPWEPMRAGASERAQRLRRCHPPGRRARRPALE